MGGDSPTKAEARRVIPRVGTLVRVGVVMKPATAF